MMHLIIQMFHASLIPCISLDQYLNPNLNTIPNMQNMRFFCCSVYEVQLLSGVTSTCSNRCTPPVWHGVSLHLESAAIPPEVQRQVPGEIQGFPYYWFFVSTEPIDAVNILPLARFEPTTSTTPPSTTPDIDATNCATETSPKKDVQEALILTTPDAVHVVYWFLFNAWHLFRSQVKA